VCELSSTSKGPSELLLNRMLGAKKSLLDSPSSSADGGLRVATGAGLGVLPSLHVLMTGREELVCPLPIWKIRKVPSGAICAVGLCENGPMIWLCSMYGPSIFVEERCTIRLLCCQLFKPQWSIMSAEYM
jgi:hypothetical protein